MDARGDGGGGVVGLSGSDDGRRERSWAAQGQGDEGVSGKAQRRQRRERLEDDSLRNWRRAVDSSSGKVYFYNKMTRETRWDAPQGAEDMLLRGWYSSLTSPNSPEEAQFDDPQEDAENSGRRRNSAAIENVDGSPGAWAHQKWRHGQQQPKQQLPKQEGDQGQDWDIRQAIDERTGRTYYYDRKSRQTFWHDPRGLESGGSDRDQQRSLLAGGAERDEEEEEEYEDANYDDDSFEDDQGGANQQGYDFEKEEEEEELLEEEQPIGLQVEHQSEQMRTAVAPPQPPPSGPAPPIEQVRSSLQLLKRRMKTGTEQKKTQSKTAAPRPAMDARSSARELQEFPEEEARFKCGSCYRQFRAEALAIHEPVCHKVFSGGNARSKKNKEATLKRASSSGVPNNKTSWRNKSMQLRAMLRQNADGASGGGNGGSSRSRNGAAWSSPELGDEAPTTGEFSEDLVPCPHCARTFNPKVAERHIPKCTDIRAKPKTLLRGSGKGAYSSTKADFTRTGSSIPSSVASTASSASPRNRRSSLPRPGSGARTSGEHALRKDNNGRRQSMPSSLASTQQRRSVAESGVHLQECPHCLRNFGKKAFDRHLEHCAKVKTAAQQDVRLSSQKSRGAGASLDAGRRSQLLDDAAQMEQLQAFLGSQEGIKFLNEFDGVEINFEDLEAANIGPFEYVEERDTLFRV